MIRLNLDQDEPEQEYYLNEIALLHINLLLFKLEKFNKLFDKNVHL